MKILIECPVCGKQDVELNVTNGIRGVLDGIEKQIVERALEINLGNINRAARKLGMAPHALRHLIEKHGLHREAYIQ